MPIFDNIHFGKVGAPKPDWRRYRNDEPDDDEELEETPKDLVKLLGFDPNDEDDDTDTDRGNPNQPRDPLGRWTDGGGSANLGKLGRGRMGAADLIPAQPASETDKSKVAEYRQKIKEGAPIAAITVAFILDLAKALILDGHHRWMAAKAEKVDTVPVDTAVVVKTKKQAVDYYRAMRFG